MTMTDISTQLQEQVKLARESKSALKIQGGNTKAFYGYHIEGETLDVSGHQGVISYEPTELVISVHAGTLLSDIKTILDEQHQMLAFEPPSFADKATIGGTIACKFSGPRRAYSGSASDFVLGSKILNGKAEILSFGGEVMKNVAGYDVSRLMAGAMGTLGVILDVSLKIVPKPESELTLLFSLDSTQALKKIIQWSQLPLPLSASCIIDQQLYVRLSGTKKGIQSAQKIMGGDVLEQADIFWQAINEQQHEFFEQRLEEQNLWRISVAPNAPKFDLEGDTLYEWGGALRWIKSHEPEERIRQASQLVQGHATCFRHSKNHHCESLFEPLPKALLKIHQNLKHSFDPDAILNPGRMYKDF